MLGRSFSIGGWVIAALAVVLCDNPTPGAVGLTGVVNSVDVEGRKLVVTPSGTSGTEKNVTVTLNDQTRMTTSQNQPIRLADVKAGDTVGIAHQGGIATSIVVNQVPLVGVVSSIDPDGKKIVLTEKGSNREVTLPIGPRTAIVTGSGGKALAIKDLKTGDGLSATYAGAEVTRIAVNPKPAELAGHVKEVAADMKSIVVTEIGTNTDVRVAITPGTTIVTGEGKTLGLKDLKKGDGVGIAHEASVASKIVVNAAAPR